jgi:hypothetical protein
MADPATQLTLGYRNDTECDLQPFGLSWLQVFGIHVFCISYSWNGQT